MINGKYTTVKLIGENIAKITIQREKSMNALNKSMVLEINKVVKELEESSDIGCVIIVGANDNFIAGADIREMNGSSVTEAHMFSAEMKALHDEIVNSNKPYIAAINGYCLGGD